MLFESCLLIHLFNVFDFAGSPFFSLIFTLFFLVFLSSFLNAADRHERAYMEADMAAQRIQLPFSNQVPRLAGSTTSQKFTDISEDLTFFLATRR